MFKNKYNLINCFNNKNFKNKINSTSININFNSNFSSLLNLNNFKQINHSNSNHNNHNNHNKIENLHKINNLEKRFKSKKVKKNLNIVLIGPPGSGKGTQTECLVNDFNLTSIKTGDLLRKETEKESEISKLIKQTMLDGTLVKDEIIFNLLTQEFEAIQNKQRGWVLDGFPRNLNQAIYLDKLLSTRNEHISHVFYLNVNDNEVAERIKGRLVHSSSGRQYHISYKPPKNPGLDDITNEPLIQREDDKPENVLSRLQTYREKTLPLLNFYQQSNRLITIEATTSAKGYAIINQAILLFFSQE
eukprot:TRINITY_DN2832_c0_g3_i1.p1 TRINITY_DN2832_c0_g3~~TRINITY_DN2832_c0_g3_i1.p1  ORF type:complete len:331 (-),score=116.83 TRINITY_DN2832_c0_g3_i1:37-945(-)